MATVQELVGLGEQMGLQGEELRDFVREQQALARATREAEREKSAKQREAEAKREENAKQREAEREAKERQFELEK